MKNLMTFEQFLNEANVTPYNLKIGYIYKSDFEIKQGPNKGKRCITEQEYVGYSGNNYTFKIVKILTPDTCNRKIGDIVLVGYGNINRDYLEIKK